jgi:hypothetical protein
MKFFTSPETVSTVPLNPNWVASLLASTALANPIAVSINRY